jgi:hypothetical protein
MVCYPEVQKKAQEELDKVLNGRLPEHTDIESLPYLSALVKEVYRYGEVSFEDYLPHARLFFLSYRWQPVTPLGRPLSNKKNSIKPNALMSSRRSASVDQRRSLQWLSYPRELCCAHQPMVRASPVAKY